MTVTRLSHESRVIFDIDGRLDAANAVTLDREFFSCYDEGARDFIWDCSKVTYLSSAGLRSFLQAMKRLEASEGKLVIAGASPQLLDVFDISGFKPLLTFAPDRAAALKA